MASAVDFDDLLVHMVAILKEHKDVRAELDRRFSYVLVDEYQDTNLAQYAIVRALSVDHPNICVTGDPDQSIYGWRGANSRTSSSSSAITRAAGSSRSSAITAAPRTSSASPTT